MEQLDAAGFLHIWQQFDVDGNESASVALVLNLFMRKAENVIINESGA